MTELAWLCDLLTKHELDPKMQKHIIKRIGFVESTYQSVPRVTSQPIMNTPSIPKVINGAMQSPSTIAAMERHSMTVQEPAQPIVVAATPQAAMAMHSREQAIAAAQSGKPEAGRTSPRKF